MDAVILAFVSGKGGTGKSTLAVMTGAALAELGKKVVLLELASGLRSVDIIAGVSDMAVFDLEDVLNGKTPPARAVVESPLYPGLAVMPAPYAGGGLDNENLWLLCVRLKQHYDYIVLDVAPGYGQAFVAAAGMAHRMIVVETPDPVALRDGRALVDSVADVNIQTRLLLNRVVPGRVLEDGLLEDLDEAIDTVGAQLLGLVPESTALAKAALAGTALPAKSVEARVMKAIAGRICGEDIPLIIR